MNIFIELPTWLGDSIMATPAIEHLTKLYPDVKFTFFGSFVASQAFKPHPNTLHVILDESKKSSLRLAWLYKKAKSLEKFDYAISFRSSKTSSLLLWFLKAKNKFQFQKNLYYGHQVQKYAQFIANVFQKEFEPQELKLYQKPFTYTRPTLGINPGATYGSAKRWYPKEFAKVAEHFGKTFDIVIFGGPNEVNIANEVAQNIQNANVLNLAGKTTVTELIEKIGGLDLFLTNDSGPMHIAAAFQVPTLTLFGPTNYKETNQWKNKNSYIISHDLDCAPCMKRVCPLHTHECMKGIKAKEVIEVLENHLSLDR